VREGPERVWFQLYVLRDRAFVAKLVDLFWLSFFDKAGEPTTEHYRAVVAVPVWLNVMMITFEIAAWTTLFSVLAGYPVAYLLATSGEATRGRLRFFDIQIEMLAPDTAQLISRYQLDRPQNPQHGINTRLMKKRDGQWVIALNHVSSKEAPCDAATK